MHTLSIQGAWHEYRTRHLGQEKRPELGRAGTAPARALGLDLDEEPPADHEAQDQAYEAHDEEQGAYMKPVRLLGAQGTKVGDPCKGP